NGLSKFEGNKFLGFSRTNLLNTLISQMTATRDGTIWIGTHDQVFLRFDGTNVSAIAKQMIGSAMNPTFDPDGAIWFGSYHQGLWRYDPSASSDSGSQLRNYAKRDGLIGDYVAEPHFSTDGALWVGGLGVSRFDGISFVNFSTT